MTPKMRKFAEGLASGLSGAEAARLAGYKGASARVNASKMRHDKRVIAEVARIKNGKPLPAHACGVDLTPLRWLLSVMHDETLDMRVRVRAAIAAAPYVDVKGGVRGNKKEDQLRKAHIVVGKFAPGRVPPRTVVPFRRPSGNDAS